MCNLNRYILTCLFSFLLLPKPQPVQAFETIGGIPVAKNEIVKLGGSFFPIHMEHLRLMAETMYRYGYTKGEFVPTMPYKKGTKPQDAITVMELTEKAVETFDEVLEINGFEFTEFKVVGKGKVTWKGPGEHRFHLSINGIDIQENIKEDTIKSVQRQFEEMGRNAKISTMIAGGDTAAPVRSEGGQSVHYKHKDPSRPGILITSIPVLEQSSSEIRKSLKDETHAYAQATLTPTIFNECLRRELFIDQDTGEIAKDILAEQELTEEEFIQERRKLYHIYSRENLEVSLRWLFKKLERMDLEGNDIEDQKRFYQMSAHLIELTMEMLKKTGDRALPVRVIHGIYEKIIEHFSALKNFRNLRKFMREKEKELGGKELVTVAVAAEIAEEVVIPPLLFFLLGPQGLALRPFIHPNEMLVLPSYAIWLYRRSQAEKRRLGGGDIVFYDQLTDYRGRLLRGDSRRIISRVELTNALGLGDSNLVVNIIRSSLPKRIPRIIRGKHDHRIKYYDLNISINELRACLNDENLSDALWESADKDKGLYSALIMTAIFQRPKARMKFYLFMGHRYFKDLYLGQVPPELLGGFDPAEREVLLQIQRSFEGTSSLDPKSSETLKELVADFYILTKLVQEAPELVRSKDF